MIEEQARPKIKLLLLCAKSSNEDSEVQLLTNNLGKVCANSVELISERVIDTGAALAAITKHQPDIVHFYGECTADGRFVFAADNGENTDWCSKRFLLKKISDLPSEIKLTYFNGVLTEQEIAAAGGKIAAFFCMKDKGDADLSRRVAAPFYTALAFGNPLGFAFRKLWEALPDKDRQIMLRFRKDIDPDKFCLRTPQRILSASNAK